MGLVGSNATFARKARRSLHHFLVLVLAVSTLSAISIAVAPPATAAGAGLSLYIKNESGRSQDATRNEFTTGTCHTLTTSTIDYQWGVGSPGGSCNVDGFTVYATGQILAPVTGTVTFCAIADDGFYLSINSAVVIDNWIDQGANSNCNSTGTYSMVAGQIYSIKTWMHENGGGATMQLLWSYTGQSSYIAVPASNLGTFCSPSSTSSGGYTILTFTSTTTCAWNVPAGVTAVEALVVGGGGAGGGGIGGGGGAGEFVETTRTGLTSGTQISISVGAGGTSNNNWNAGNAGGQSRFDSVIAYGGGGGGTNSSNPPVASGGPNFGSQGGGGYENGALTVSSRSDGITGYRNNGGSGSFGASGSATGGGGGGAGGVGGAGTTSSGSPAQSGGAGGAGRSSSITGTATFYAAGGGGGVNGAAETPNGSTGASSGNPGTGGSGIGGSGGAKANAAVTGQYGNRGNGTGGTVNSNGSAGAANTGSGGGGASNWVSGGAGGSGVVIIRYLNAPAITLSTSTISATVGEAVTSYSISNSGGAAASYAISPSLAVSGLSFSTSTGLISGTPSATASSATYTITATNSTSTATATFSISSNAGTPSAPTITGITAGNTTLSVAFTAPSSNGGATISNYEYSTDGGANWRPRDAGTTASPLVINTTSAFSPLTLVNGTTYNVQIRAVNSVGNGPATASTSGTPNGCNPTSSTSGGFTVLTFTNTTSCQWSVPAGVTSAEVLIVAGGGGGNRGVCSVNYGAGGGGGGFSLGTRSLTPGDLIAVTVGAGGSAALINCGGTRLSDNAAGFTPDSGTDGGSSSFGAFSASGGLAPLRTSLTGGSSGNGLAGGTIGSSGTSCGSHVNNCGAGGGGGAQNAGSGLNGGAGVTSSISGTSKIYGGGGPGRNNTVNGTSGDGLYVAGSTPTANTGGGGSDITAGAAGVVIVRYINAPSISLSTSTISATVGTAITSYSISNSGGAAASYAISPSLADSGLTGLTFSTSTGLISGTPSAVATSATFTITATNSSGTSTASFSITTTAGSALTPTFGSTTATATGFTVQISNYSSDYTWGGSATASGSVAISGTGLVTVTGVAPGTSSTATITTTRTGYTGGSATVSATSITGAALTPTFGSTTATADGFTVEITNYSASYTWGGTATASGSVSINGSGLVTVTGVAPGTSSTATITTTRTGYTGGSATVSATSISCAAGGVCVVGDTGPGGGIVFYVAPSGGTFACGQSLSSTCKYLEAAPITGASAWTDTRYAWSGNINTAIGTTSTAIGTGYSNTLKMVRQSGAGTSGAGSAARNYRGGGLNDWYLPSKDELNQLFINRTVASASDGYWSSSEYNATGAWDQGFGNGSQGVADPGKQQTTPVRPIRAFGSSAVESAIIYVPAIAGVTAPVRGATPVTTVTAANGYTGTVTWSSSPSTFAAATTYTATITLTAASGFTLTGVTANFFTVSGATSVTHLANSGSITAVFPATAASPALTPAFGSPTATATGFTVQISNYSSDYTWGGSATASGSVSINGSGLVTVTGVAPGTSSTATITTTRAGYTGGSATVSATSITGAALTPTFGSTTATADGFTVQISNYSASYTWGGTATASGSVSINGTGLVTVTGVALGTSSTATITTTRTGYTGGSATVSATSLSACSVSETSASGYTTLRITSVGSCVWTTPSGVTTAEVLVVGGGGGGGGAHDNATSGGGGAGYVYANSTESISGNIMVSVGAGGAGGVGVTAGTPQNGNSGGNSTFGSVTALGGAGGFGGYESWTGACPTYTTPVKGGTAATLSQAATGGQDGCFNRNGFGGGGQSSTTNQTGGAGLANSITGTSVTYGTGGTGGTKTTDVTPTAQASNTGNGGTGAASRSSFGRTGGTGGSGVVIIRYINAPAITLSTSTISATVGTTITNLTVTNSGGAATFTISPSLPSGLNINSSTGVVSGTPSATAISATYTITATNTTGTATATLSITVAAGAALTPTFGSTTATADGFTVQISNYSASYTWGGSATASGSVAISDSGLVTVTGVAPGTSSTATITTTRTGYTGGSATVSATSLQTAQTITRTSTSPGSPVVAGTYTPTATASSGLTVAIAIASGSSSICSISGGVVTFNTAGSCVIQYNQAGNASYAAASQVTETLTISKASQSITFGSLSNRTLGSGTYSISATSSSSLTVAFTSATSSVCTVATTTITLVTAGTCTINANQAGNTNYLAAAQVQRSFTIATALLITTPSGASLQGTYNTAFTSLTISSSGGAGTNSFSATGSLPTGVSLSSAGVISGTPTIAGNFSLTVTVTDANGATATTSSFTISIAKGVSSISISAPAYTFTGSPQGPDSVTTSGSAGAVTYAYAGRGSTTYTSSSTKPTNVGTYTVTATLAADSNFASVSATADFAITAGSALTPAFGSTTATADGFTVQISNYSSDYTWGGSATASGSVAISGTGLVTVTGVAPGTSSTATITTTRTGYTGGSATVSATSISSNVATLSALTLTTATLSPTFASVTTSYTASVANATTSITVTPTRTQANATITVNGTAVTSGSASGAISLNVGANTITVVVTAQDGTTTATYTVTVTRALETYTITLAAGTNGSGSNQTLTKTNGTNLTLPDSANANGYFTRAGYTVSGWSTSNGGSQTHALGGSFTTEAATTLYPVWTAVSCSPTSSTAFGYTIYKFTTTGTCFWTVPDGITNVDVLVVAGGGGGGYSWGNTGAGGGGGGQVKTGTATLSSPLEVTVGAGGSAGTLSSGRGGSGGNSSAAAITALGGTGGCGLAAPTCSVASMATALAAANGGAGAASPGNGTRGKGGGGSSTTVSISGSETGGVGTGSDYSGTSVNYGVGGNGGSPNGSSPNSVGSSGSVNTGNGGGGASTNSASNGNSALGANGGAGGSGVVIIRKANTLTVTYNANGGTTPSGGSATTVTGGTVSSLATTSRTGYTLAGWFTQSSGGTQITTSAGHNYYGNFTLYAQWTANALTVTYDSQGGSAISNGSTTTGGSISASPGTPTRAGYTFNGWFAASTGGFAISFPHTHARTANFTLYAQWTANSLTITFDAQGGSAVTNGGSQTGASIFWEPTAPTRTGYTLAGWSTTTTGSVVTFPFAHGQTANFTLYAIWSANSLTVTYDSQGGSAVTSGGSQTGASISAAPTAPTRAGYTFGGWSVTDGGTAVTFPYAHGQTADFTLFAKWSANALTITYNSQGGSAVTSGSVNTAASISAAPTAPIRAGYTFGGWSATDTGTAVTFPYAHGQTADFTLFGKWSANALTITYNSQGGSAVSAGSVNTGASISAAPTAPTRAGYTFGGWAATDTGTAVTFPYAHGQTANFTMYAKWAALTTNAITYNNQSATTSHVGGSTTYTSDAAIATIPTTAPLRIGYTFAGWFTESSAGTEVTNGSYTPASPFGAITLYAQWTANSLTVTYNSKGGTTVSNDSVNTAASISSAPTAPTRAGYLFSGWSTTDGGTAITFPYSHGQTANFTLYALWTAGSLVVTYDSQGGSAVSNGAAETGVSISSAPTAPTRTGYNFNGWSTTETGTVVTFPFAHGQTANFTLYARWSLKVYVVAFNSNSGTGTMGNQSFTHGVATNLNANLYSRVNYVFHRWATAADGTGTTFNNFAQATLTAETTLYAQWTANTYVVTFNYNGGDGGESTATASFTTAGSPITLPVPTKTGFTFAGWHSDAALTTAIGSGGGSGSYSPTGAVLSLNAYAKWTAINYTFTYNSNSSDSGSVPTESSKQITQTATVKANTGNLVRVGYTFSGWNTATDGTETNYLSGSLFTVGSENVVLYAKWSPNTYTVTYNTNGGTGNAQRSASNVTSDTYTTDSSPVVFPGVGTLTRSGYTFGGWNTSAAGTGTNYVATNTYTTVSNVIFYAKWNPVTYTITYNGNQSDGGTTPTAGGYTTGQDSPYVVLTNSFTKTSSVFGGWNTADNGTGISYSPGASITTLTDIVLYAVWIPQYTLHYAINGGSVTSGSLPGDQLYNTGTSVGPLFSAVSRTGYTFGGWVNGSTTIVPNGNFTILADSVLTAKWNPINYTISYNSDGGSEAPESTTRQIGQSFTVDGAVSKPGYNFAGWATGSTVVGPDAVVVMGSANIAYTARWVARVYTISFDWNGGRGTAVEDVNYTFGTTAITLPLVGDRVKDGYTFAGWSETSTGSLLSATYMPSRTRTLIARWTVGSFTITYNLSGGTLANSSVAVQNGSPTVLPLPTRTNFVFDGWHTATIGGSPVGANGDSFTPTASQTVYARWIQASLFGISNSLTRIGSVVTVANIANTFSGANSNSSVSVSVPENALPAGTTINFDLVGNSSRATGLLPNVNYLISIAISWITADGLVPDTVPGKPISVTISNETIKIGATAYAIVNNVSTLLGTATQDRTITIALTSDPEIVVAAVKPSAPLNVAATSNGNQQSVISWSAPSTNGGSDINSYTVTSNTSATCTTTTTSCTISGLAHGTAYTFTVTATNNVGTSDASTSASATTAALYTVAFNAKGGTPVANGSFLTASTVSEPTAPTRAGYSFAGWSATDGGSAIGFPYAPGVTSNITLFARWDALDNAVTFNSKGGSTVSSSVFSSGGTVAEPTAPTRAGFTFAGWSATDTGTAVTFPYAPGVVTDITLYAKWTEIVQNSVRSNVTVVAPVTVIGDKDVKVNDVVVAMPASGSSAKPPIIKIDEPSEKFIAEVKVLGGKLVLTPETGFSGKRTVTVTITENSADRIIQIPLMVLPEMVTKPTFTPINILKSTIRWAESPNATTYAVYINDKKICSTSGTSCNVNRILGPNASVEIVSNGGDKTLSEKIEAVFKLSDSVVVGRIVFPTIAKAAFTEAEVSRLRKIVSIIKSQGFKKVVISEITTTKKTAARAEARIALIKKYLQDRVGSIALKFEVEGPAIRTNINNIYLKT